MSAKRRYHNYLRSPEWAVRRQWMLDEASYRCQLCGESQSLQVHHRSYDNVGRERKSDLTVLCGDCHARFHDKVASPAPQRTDGLSAYRKVVSTLARTGLIPESVLPDLLSALVTDHGMRPDPRGGWAAPLLTVELPTTLALYEWFTYQRSEQVRAAMMVLMECPLLIGWAALDDLRVATTHTEGS